MQWLYFACLIFVIGCLTLTDWRFKLAYFSNARRAGLTVLIGVLLFIVWDALGIGLGIFHHGGSPFTLPVRLAPEFPVEELLFLYLLCYTTLLLYLGGRRLWPRM